MPKNQVAKRRLLFCVLVLISLIISMASGLSACKPKPEETDLLFETIEQQESPGTGRPYAASESKLLVIARPEEVTNLNEWIRNETELKLQDVDYNQHFVLAVFQGWKPSAGYRVEVKRVTQLGNSVNVYVQFYEPKPNEEKADVETSPYHLVQVQTVGAKGKEITFNLLSDETVILSVSHVIP